MSNEADRNATREQLRAGFDEDPEAYHRTRPVCPPRLFDDLVALGDFRPGARIVEIGTGTGQATVPLAERGLRIVGIELGERLAALARQKLACFPEVEIVHSSFEAWEPAKAGFDGVVAVHAIHWLDPRLRYAKTARLLRDDGVLAIVRSRYVVPDDADPFWGEVQKDYDAVRPGAGEEAPLHPDAVRDLGDEIEASGYFRNVAVHRYLWSTRYAADDYLALLATSSWHRALDDASRRWLFERIRRRIEAHPDRAVSPTLLSTLNVARRR